MTSIVGVLCNDGAVIGADSAATFSASPVYRTIEQPTEKIKIVQNVIVAGTGQIGLNQRFAALVDQAYQGTLPLTSPTYPGHPPKQPVATRLFTKESPLDIVKAVSRAAIEEMDFTHFRPGEYGALMAFPCRNEPHLCEFAQKDFQPELKDKNIWYVSMGSAQGITDPFLGFIRSVFWASGPPSIGDGIFAAFWTLHLAVELNTGGVQGPIRIAVLERSAQDDKFTARMFEEPELAEHAQNVLLAHSALRDFRKLQQQQAAPADVADVPKLAE